jgi:hypothetical protein
MKSIPQIVYALTIVLLLPASLVAGESNVNTRARKEAVQLTRQIESASRKIQDESAHLSAMQRNNHISSRSHQYRLQTIANQVNEQLRPALTRLAEIQPDLPQWNQQAIERMRSSAATIAFHANEAVLNRNQAGPSLPVSFDTDYRRLVKNISDHAEVLTQVADATVDYGTAQLKGTQAGLPITTHD